VAQFDEETEDDSEEEKVLDGKKMICDEQTEEVMAKGKQVVKNNGVMF
jgi:hypothetical protein